MDVVPYDSAVIDDVHYACSRRNCTSCVESAYVKFVPARVKATLRGLSLPGAPKEGLQGSFDRSAPGCDCVALYRIGGAFSLWLM